MEHIKPKYTQEQIQAKAQYHGLYVFFSTDRPWQPMLYGRALKLAIAKHMRQDRVKEKVYN